MAARLNRTEAQRWLLAALTWAPYGLIWLSPLLFTEAPLVATGFPQNDQPVYLANGRAVFERGNGFFGPNAFDPDPNAPAIYFHWLTWCFGALTVLGRLDPGVVYLLVGVTAGLWFSRLTVELVYTLSKSAPKTELLCLLAMWGGGIAVLTRVLEILVAGEPRFERLSALEPFEGWWLLPWGRNAVYATEAVYHVTVLGAWLAFLRGHFARLVLWVAAAATTHPFTGAQLIACVGVWLALNQVAPAATGVPRVPWQPLAAFTAVAVMFVGYYLGYLPSFPQHARIQTQFARDWVETPLQTCVAYLPVAALAAVAILRSRSLQRSQGVFFGAFALTSFALAHHDWFAPSHQPLHFARGYAWLSLFVLGLPLLRELLDKLSRAGRLGAVALAAVLGLACLDNATFIARQADPANAAPVAAVDQEVLTIFDRIQRDGLEGVLLSNDQYAGYLAATYTRARPYFGHAGNTPDGYRRMREIRALFETGRAGPWLQSIDLILMYGRLMPDPSLELVFAGKRFSLYRRKR